MFTLVTDRSRFYRVKRGQSGKDVENALSVPAADVFGGAIIPREGKFIVYSARPGDSYESLAERFGVGAEELKAVNRSSCVYPTRRLFIPRK